MAKDVRLLISANADRADEEIRKLQRTGHDATSIMERDFEQLGIRSTLAIEKERAAVVAAYDKIRASGVASADETSRAYLAMNAKLNALDKQRGINMLSNDTRAAATEARALESALGGVNNVLGAMGVTLGIAGIVKVAGDVRQARIEMDAITNSLAAGVQSSELAGLEFEYVSKRAEYLGLNLQKTAMDYASLVAASKGTSMEGEKTRAVFDGVTTASTALHLSADKTSNVLRALTQMMSKGTVQSEELKGQLGEALPGAFQLAAKAMGWTTAELQKHLDKGEVMASEMLPKLAAEMQNRFGKQIPDAIKSTQAEMNRLDNALFKLKLSLADSGMFSSFARGGTQVAEVAQDIIMYTGQAKVFWEGMLDKAKAWVNAGGLIGLLRGGKGARDELKAEFDAIDQMTQRGWDKWLERGGKKRPEVDQKGLAAQRQQEIDARQAAEREAAEKAKQDAQKLMAAELAAFRAHQDSKTALTREQKALELSDLKDRYERGLVATADYYEQQKRIAVEASQQELANTQAYLAKETALLNNIKGRTKKGEKDPEYVEELAKHEKAIEAVRISEVKLQKTTVDEGIKITAALKQRTDEYLKMQTVALDSAGEFEAAEAMKQAAYRRSSEYLKLEADALSGNADAWRAMLSLEQKEAADTVASQNKKIEANRQLAEEIAKLTDELDKLNGGNEEQIKANAELRDGLSKEAVLRDRLRAAIASGNQSEISGLNEKIRLQDQLNQRLQKELELSMRKGVLSGQITGVVGSYDKDGRWVETPIYSDSYQRQQAANGYVTDSRLTSAPSGSGTPAADDYWNSGYLNSNYWNTAANQISGARAGGGPVQPYSSYIVGEKGPEVLRLGSQGGTVIPNDKLGGSTVYQINLGGITLPNVTAITQAAADDMLRALMPKIQVAMGRTFRG
jgi:tape measure domain-containing protein